MTKKAALNIRIDEELKRDITDYAKLKRVDISDFVIDEILTILRSYFIKCPKCQRACFDKRDVHIVGKAVVKCPWCSHEFKHNFA